MAKRVTVTNLVSGPSFSLKNMPVDNGVDRSTYVPKFIRQTLHLPPDNRNESEKACDAFLFFAHDLYTYGLADAVNLWRSMTSKPLPEHPVDCAQCRVRFRRSPGFTIRDNTAVDDLLASAAKAVEFVKRAERAS